MKKAQTVMTLPKAFGEESEQPGGNGRRKTLADVRAHTMHPLRLKVTDRALPARPLRLKLTDGELSVNGRKVPVLRGISRHLTGAALKSVADIYQGHSLYISDNGSFTRVRDTDVVELLPDTEFVSRDERPRTVVSQPRYNGD